jgi:hypothetical protein
MAWRFDRISAQAAGTGPAGVALGHPDDIGWHFGRVALRADAKAVFDRTDAMEGS